MFLHGFKRGGLVRVWILVLIVLLNVAANGQNSAFTYQGSLNDNGNPANGNYDFQFKLFDLLNGGAQQGTTQTVTNIVVANGRFSVSLDFGACASCFNGSARFLEISVMPTGG